MGGEGDGKCVRSTVNFCTKYGSFAKQRDFLPIVTLFTNSESAKCLKWYALGETKITNTIDINILQCRALCVHTSPDSPPLRRDRAWS